MNSRSNPADDQLVWPPLEEDLEAIEVLEIPWPESAPPPAPVAAAEPAASAAAPAPRTPAPEVVAQPAPPTPPPPAPPATRRQGVIEVVELDAVAGTESYVLDIRAPSMPDIGRSQSGATEAAGRELQWPPTDADLDAVEVLDLAPPEAGVVHEPPSETEPRVVVEPPEREPLALEPAPEVPDEAAAATGPDRYGHLLASQVAAGSPSPFWRVAVGLGLAAALVGGVWVGIAWMQRPGSPSVAVTPPPTPSPPAPRAPEGSAAPVAPAVNLEPAGPESLLGDARAALGMGDRLRAVDLVGAYRQQGGRDPSAVALAEQVLTAARAEADRARRDATARLGATAPDDLADPSRREAAAWQAWQAGQYGRALRGLIDARQGFARLQPPAASAAPLPTSAPTVADATTTGAIPSRSSPAPVSPVSPAPAVGGSASTNRTTEGGSTAPVGLGVRAGVSPAPPAAPPPASAPDAGEALPGSVADAGIRRALRAYQSAYETLDARAAAAVYPAVDERALARAFAGLNSQKLEFDRCDVTPQADGRARASCTGRTAFVPRVGNQAPRVEMRRWNFLLEPNGDAWRIAQAQVSAR